MKDRLLVATLAGVGFLATLGISGLRGDLWQPGSAPTSPPLARTRVPTDVRPIPSVAIRPVTPAPASDAAVLPPSAAPAPTDLNPGGREDAASAPAPTYEDQSAAHDRAAAHGARSR